MVRETLLERRTLAAWFRHQAVERYVAEHLDGRRDHANRLWPLLVLSVWVERFRVGL